MVQQAAPTFVGVPVPDGATKPPHAVGVTEPEPVPKQFAFTVNALNLIVGYFGIGRYGFNFEYQPLPHHGLVVTPHFDHGNGAPNSDGSFIVSDTLTGFGAELGYRFYSGTQGFNGFFAGPSLLIAKYDITSTYHDTICSAQGCNNSFSVRNETFSSVGGALDVGGQWQLGHFVIGGSVGVRYTKIKDNVLPVDNILDMYVGGGLYPRLALNLGYAF